MSLTSAFKLVPDAIRNGVIVEYGKQLKQESIKEIREREQNNQTIDHETLEYDDQLYSFVILSLVKVENENCLIGIRIKKQLKQNGLFYLHSVQLLENVKTISQETVTFSNEQKIKLAGDDPIDIFRAAKKTLFLKNTK